MYTRSQNKTTVSSLQRPVAIKCGERFIVFVYSLFVLPQQNIFLSRTQRATTMGQCASSQAQCEDTVTTNTSPKSTPRTVCFTSSLYDFSLNRDDTRLQVERELSRKANYRGTSTKLGRPRQKKRGRKRASRRRTRSEGEPRISYVAPVDDGKLLETVRDRHSNKVVQNHLGCEGNSKASFRCNSPHRACPKGQSRCEPTGSWGSLSIQKGIIQKVRNSVDKPQYTEVTMNDASGNTVLSRFDHDSSDDMLDPDARCLLLDLSSSRRPLHRDSKYLPKNPARLRIPGGSSMERERNDDEARSCSLKLVIMECKHQKPLSPWNPHNLPSSKDYREQVLRIR